MDGKEGKEEKEENVGKIEKIENIGKIDENQKDDKDEKKKGIDSIHTVDQFIIWTERDEMLDIIDKAKRSHISIKNAKNIVLTKKIGNNIVEVFDYKN